MKENKVQFIAITAMAVALTYVFTAFVNVRLPIIYIYYRRNHGICCWSYDREA